MATYPWKKKFGLKKNREPNPSIKYELQVGTYALGLESKLSLPVDNIDITYYKKDDSSFKFVNIDKKYKKKAKEYWEEVATVCKQSLRDIEPGEHLGVPFESWECNYCQYKKYMPFTIYKKDLTYAS